MDITTTKSNTAITSAASVKTPEAETETPTRIQQTKPSSFSNGVLKRHQAVLRHHQHAALVVTTYKECLKNHAANLGRHAVDGCGEFMPSPTATPTDPTSLKCAACGCHRNFHRREPEEPLLPPNTTAALEYQPHHRHHPPPPVPPTHHRNSGEHSIPSSPSPPPISSSYYPSAPHMLLALSAGLSGPPQDSNIPITPTTANAHVTANGRKRSRTKFTPDQKRRMLDFAERLGWKIQKRDEDLIAEFCNEIGVDKVVLKVWMHNNKNTFGKRDQSNISAVGAAANANLTPTAAAAAAAATNNGNGMEFTIHYHHQQNHESNNDNKNGNHNNDLIHNSDSVSAPVMATNGSSSSS